MFYITWQPASAESGHYFLTLVEGAPDMPLSELMAKARQIEELEMDTYDLCSIIYVSPEAHDGETQIIY